MSRLDYFLRRLLLVIPTFLGITLLCFSITQFLPGGPVDQMMMRMKGMGSGGEASLGGGGGDSASQEAMARERENFRKVYGFDKPLWQRYWTWLWKERCGMLSRSYKFSNKTAWEMISQRFPVSLVFGLSSFLLTYLVCIPLGVSKAVRHGTPFDMLSSVVVFTGYAIPVFALGMLLKMLFCGTTEGFWDWLPATGFQSPQADTLPPLAKLWDRLQHMLLPVLCYVAGSFAMLTLLMKNSLLEQINSDYIRTVYAKGGSSRQALWGHALRNALIPVATGFGSILTVMFAGSVIIERVFEIPGMGNLSMEAIVGRDYPVFMGILALTSILALLGDVLSDFCYVVIDPRIHFN